jgi:hypothetical protein
MKATVIPMTETIPEAFLRALVEMVEAHKEEIEEDMKNGHA